nr:uncharacterized protein LOC108069950 [Drosophila takahashii]
MKLFIVGIVVLAGIFLGANEGSAKLLENDCGTVRSISRHKRVIGGRIAGVLENPWMALLLSDNKDDNDFCTGSLITSRT